MGENASLGEFGTPGADRDGSGRDANDTGNDDGDGGGDPDTAGVGVLGDDTDVAPTISTYGWTPEGTTCENCGDPARRRWRNGDAMICRDCKEW